MRSPVLSLLALATSGLCLDAQVELTGASKGRAHGLQSYSDDAPPYREQLLQLHKAWVDVSSISGTEEELGNVIVETLQNKGYNVVKQPVAPLDNTPKGSQRFNILASFGDISDAKVLISSHYDVVPPHIPYAIDDGEVTKDTMIRGRGSDDAKASVAAIMVAVDEMLTSGKLSHDQVMMLFVVGEEIGGDGMVTFSDSLKEMDPPLSFEAAILGEPTENKLVCAHKGAVSFHVKAKGVAGHSGYPWLGKSANAIMVRALAKLLDADLGSSEELGNTTVNVGLLDGGVAGNVIAEDSLAHVMIRVAAGSEEHGHEAVVAKVKAIFEEIDDEAFEFSFSPGYGPVKFNCDVKDFETITVNYGTDAPHLKGNFVKYLYGPGSILVAHGARENVTVGDLETAVENYKNLILHALGQ